MNRLISETRDHQRDGKTSTTVDLKAKEPPTGAATTLDALGNHAVLSTTVPVPETARLGPPARSPRPRRRNHRHSACRAPWPEMLQKRGRHGRRRTHARYTTHLSFMTTMSETICPHRKNKLLSGRVDCLLTLASGPMGWGRAHAQDQWPLYRRSDVGSFGLQTCCIVWKRRRRRLLKATRLF